MVTPKGGRSAQSPPRHRGGAHITGGGAANVVPPARDRGPAALPRPAARPRHGRRTAWAAHHRRRSCRAQGCPLAGWRPANRFTSLRRWGAKAEAPWVGLCFDTDNSDPLSATVAHGVCVCVLFLPDYQGLWSTAFYTFGLLTILSCQNGAKMGERSG